MYNYKPELEKYWKGNKTSDTLTTPYLKTSFSKKESLAATEEAAVIAAEEEHETAAPEPILEETATPETTTPSFDQQLQQVQKLEALAPVTKEPTPLEPVVLATPEPVAPEELPVDNSQQISEKTEKLSQLKKRATQSATKESSLREVASFGSDMEKALLTDIHDLQLAELKVRLIQMVSELKNRAELEAFRVAAAIRQVQEEAAAKHTDILLQQKELYEMQSEQQLALKEAELNTEMAKAIDALSRKYTDLMNESLAKQQSQLHAEYKSDLAAQIQTIETQLQAQLQSEVQTLTDIHEEEKSRRLEQLESFNCQLKALHTILESRSVYESFSHQVHKVSVACLALCNQIESSKPLHEQLTLLQAAGRGDDLIEAVLASIPTSVANQGAPTVVQLLHRFKSVHQQSRQAALVPKNAQDGLLGKLAGKVLATVTFAPSGPIEGNDAEAILARTNHFLENGDLLAAVKQMEALTDYPAEVASEWMEEAKSRLLLEQAAEVIKAHVSLLASSCS